MPPIPVSNYVVASDVRMAWWLRVWAPDANLAWNRR